MVKQGYKQTEIGVIPEEWDMKELGELGDVKMCKRVFQHQTSEYGEIPFFKIGTFGKEPDAYISRKHFEEFKLKFSYPKVGEILISAAGTIGRTVVYNGEESYFQDSNIVWIENREEIISNKLLKYVLEVIKYNTEGGTIQRLYNNILKSTLFVCPPLAEQEAIASALSDADAWIDSLEQLIAKKRLIKQGAMQTLLTPKEDWEEQNIISICDNIIDYRGVTPKKLGMDWGDGDIVALSAGNVKKGYIDFNTECYLGSESLYKRWMRNGDPKKGDIVFTLEAPLGNISLIPDDNKYILSQRTILLQLNQKYSSKYIFQLMLSSKFQNYISESATGSTAQGIKRQTFEKLIIHIPSLSEQERIATILSDMDTELEALEIQLSKARQIKQGMMQELLTGRVRLV